MVGGERPMAPRLGLEEAESFGGGRGVEAAVSLSEVRAELRGTLSRVESNKVPTRAGPLAMAMAALSGAPTRRVRLDGNS